MPRLGPTTPQVHRYTCGLGSSPFARHYWGNHCCFLFLEVLRCFSSLRSPPTANMPGMTALQAAGLSHSETRGSKVICTSPRLIAAYRVLHRLHEPRHPPCALSYFSYRHARKTSGRRSYFQPDLAGSHEPGVLVIVISTTVLLVQHVKDRYGASNTPGSGEYRARTDDLLHAMQAL